MTRSAFLWRGALFFALLHALVWASHAAVYLATPVGAPTPNNLVWLYSLLLAGIAASVPLLGARLYKSFGSLKDKPALIYFDALVAQPWLVPALTGIAALGVALHLYAKLAFVDYSDLACVTFLRFVWIGQGYLDGPYRELASKAGHLLSAFALPAIFVLLLGREQIQARSLAWRGIVLFILVVLYAAPIMSRSVLFFVTALSFSAFLLGLMLRPGEARDLRRAAIPLVAVMIAVALLLSAAIFWDRYTCGASDEVEGLEMQEIGRRYLLGNATGLDLRSKLTTPSPTGGGDLLDNSVVNRAMAPVHRTLVDVVPQVGMITVYISHGLGNFAEVLSLERRSGNAVWRPLHSWLSRLGLPLGKTERGRWGLGTMPLAAAAWYDFGAIGVVVAGLLLGLATFTGMLLATRMGLIAGLGLVLLMVTVELVAWSGLAFSASFLLPFFGFAALVTALLAWTGQIVLRRRPVAQAKAIPAAD